MQAVRIKNRLSLHSVWDFTFKTSVVGQLGIEILESDSRGFSSGGIAKAISGHLLSRYFAYICKKSTKTTMESSEELRGKYSPPQTRVLNLSYEYSFALSQLETIEEGDDWSWED